MQLIVAPFARHDSGPQVANLIEAGEEDKLHEFVGAVTGAMRGCEALRDGREIRPGEARRSGPRSW
jgi:hypothetical protein